MEFPLYRKLNNNQSYYKIISERSFEEIQFFGKNKTIHLIQANQYPELLRIQDMLHLTIEGIEAINEDVYEQVKR